MSLSVHRDLIWSIMHAQLSCIQNVQLAGFVASKRVCKQSWACTFALINSFFSIYKPTIAKHCRQPSLYSYWSPSRNTVVLFVKLGEKVQKYLSFCRGVVGFSRWSPNARNLPFMTENDVCVIWSQYKSCTQFRVVLVNLFSDERP